jgi:hypothetical protein
MKKNNHFCNLKITEERSEIRTSGSGSISQRYGSADLDAHQNVTDPQQGKLVRQSMESDFIQCPKRSWLG